MSSWVRCLIYMKENETRPIIRTHFKLMRNKETFVIIQIVQMNNSMSLTVNQIAKVLGISRERVENILHNERGILGVLPRWVPRILTTDQKHNKLKLVMSQANLAFFEADPASLPERCWVHTSSQRVRDQTTIQPSGNTTLLPINRGPRWCVSSVWKAGLRLLGCKGHCVH